MTADYQLGLADYAVLAAMFGAVGWIVWRCARGSSTVEGYFLADRSAPGWRVGLSFIGASISSLGLLAFPAVWARCCGSTRSRPSPWPWARSCVLVG